MAKTKSQESSLRECLDELGRILSYQHLYGGREIMQARDFERRLKNLLAPEDPATLEAEARAFIAVNGPIVEANKKRTLEREEQAAADAKAQKSLRDEHAADVAERIEKAEERRLAQLAAVKAGTAEMAPR